MSAKKVLLVLLAFVPSYLYDQKELVSPYEFNICLGSMYKKTMQLSPIVCESIHKATKCTLYL